MTGMWVEILSTLLSFQIEKYTENLLIGFPFFLEVFQSSFHPLLAAAKEIAEISTMRMLPSSLSHGKQYAMEVEQTKEEKQKMDRKWIRSFF